MTVRRRKSSSGTSPALGDRDAVKGVVLPVHREVGFREFGEQKLPRGIEGRARRVE